MQELTAQELACLCFLISDPTALSLTSPIPHSISSVYPISAAFSDPVCFNASTSLSDLTIKLDTACSHNMSGNSDRLFNTMPTNIRVKGFNDTSSKSCCNSWSQQQLQARTLYPQYALRSCSVLLCAADYTQQGATMLFPNKGSVLALSSAEQQYLRSKIQDKPILKELTVRNNTYEVVDAPPSFSLPTPPLQQAYASTVKFMSLLWKNEF